MRTLITIISLSALLAGLNLSAQELPRAAAAWCQSSEFTPNTLTGAACGYACLYAEAVKQGLAAKVKMNPLSKAAINAANPAGGEAAGGRNRHPHYLRPRGIRADSRRAGLGGSGHLRGPQDAVFETGARQIA